jgi:hypothetical protein
MRFWWETSEELGSTMTLAVAICIGFGSSSFSFFLFLSQARPAKQGEVKVCHDCSEMREPGERRDERSREEMRGDRE